MSFSFQKKNLAIISNQLAQLLGRLAPQNLPMGMPFIKKLFEAYQKGAIYLKVTSQEAIQLANMKPLIGSPQKPAPLLLQNNRLYFARLWFAEQKITHYCLSQAKITQPINAKSVLELLASSFSNCSPDQKTILALALRKKLLIISGGPGTGKTTLAAYLSALFVQYASRNNKKTARIAIIAPNHQGIQKLNRTINIMHPVLLKNTEIVFSVHITTLNKCLGTYIKKNTVRPNTKNPLFYDAIIVDEASLIDIEQMAQLIDQLDSNTHLILLGDPAQLSFASCNNILTEIYHTPTYQDTTINWLNKINGSLNLAPNDSKIPDQLSDCIVILTKKIGLSHSIAIRQLAELVIAGNTKDALCHINEALIPQTAWGLISDQLAEHALQKRNNYLAKAKKGDPESAFMAFEDFMLLTLTPAAFYQLNQQQEYLLEKMGHKAQQDDWYIGRPVWVQAKNSINTLFVGSIGLTLRTEDGLKVFFPKIDGSGFECFCPAHLPKCATAFALPLYKSHGLIFKHVWLLLESQHETLDRQWLDFAMARAQQSILFLGSNPTDFTEAISRNRSFDTTLVWRTNSDKSI
jgi:exodeoxyribonuclease V alpha subunit